MNQLVAQSVRRHGLLYFAIVVLGALVIVALFAGTLAPRDPLAIDATQILKPPSREFLLGTDRFGRDILSRLMFGTRISLGTAFLSVGVATLIGVLIGMLAGFHGRWVDQVLMRAMDVLFTVPALLLAITVAAAFGPSTTNASLAIAVVFTPVFARVTRGAVLGEVGREYIDAARVIGVRDSRVLIGHILPNILTPIVVQISLALAAAILLESGLDFLGLGTQPPTASWGTLLNEGSVFLVRAPWLTVFPDIVIAVAVLMFFLIGDGLRDWLDPRTRTKH